MAEPHGVAKGNFLRPALFPPPTPHSRISALYFLIGCEKLRLCNYGIFPSESEEVPWHLQKRLSTVIGISRQTR